MFGGVFVFIHRNARIALVGSSLGEVRGVMVEGESGVLAAAPGALAPEYEPSLRRLVWPNGAVAQAFSAQEPDSLRGPQFDAAWVAEVHRLVQRKWSPEQVSCRLLKEGRLSIGTATIYRWVAKDKARGGRSWLQTRQLSRRYRKGYRVVDRRGR